jgi:hypothetical protein
MKYDYTDKFVTWHIVIPELKHDLTKTIFRGFEQEFVVEVRVEALINSLRLYLFASKFHTDIGVGHSLCVHLRQVPRHTQTTHTSHTTHTHTHNTHTLSVFFVYAC